MIKNLNSKVASNINDVDDSLSILPLNSTNPIGSGFYSEPKLFTNGLNKFSDAKKLVTECNNKMSSSQYVSECDGKHSDYMDLQSSLNDIYKDVDSIMNKIETQQKYLNKDSSLLNKPHFTTLALEVETLDMNIIGNDEVVVENENQDSGEENSDKETIDKNQVLFEQQLSKLLAEIFVLEPYSYAWLIKQAEIVDLQIDYYEKKLEDLEGKIRAYEFATKNNVAGMTNISYDESINMKNEISTIKNNLIDLYNLEVENENSRSYYKLQEELMSLEPETIEYYSKLNEIYLVLLENDISEYAGLELEREIKLNEFKIGCLEKVAELNYISSDSSAYYEKYVELYEYQRDFYKSEGYNNFDFQSLEHNINQYSLLANKYNELENLEFWQFIKQDRLRTEIIQLKQQYGISNTADKEYLALNGWQKFGQGVGSAFFSGVASFLKPLENVADGAISIVGSTGVTELFGLPRDDVANFVGTSWTDVGYSVVVEACGINEYVAYSNYQVVGSYLGMFGSAFASALIPPPYSWITSGLMSCGSMTELGLNNGMTFGQATGVGVLAGLTSAAFSTLFDKIKFDVGHSADSVLVNKRILEGFFTVTGESVLLATLELETMNYDDKEYQTRGQELGASYVANVAGSLLALLLLRRKGNIARHRYSDQLIVENNPVEAVKRYNNLMDADIDSPEARQFLNKYLSDQDNMDFDSMSPEEQEFVMGAVISDVYGEISCSTSFKAYEIYKKNMDNYATSVKSVPTSAVGELIQELVERTNED